MQSVSVVFYMYHTDAVVVAAVRSRTPRLDRPRGHVDGCCDEEEQGIVSAMSGNIPVTGEVGAVHYREVASFQQVTTRSF